MLSTEQNETLVGVVFRPEPSMFRNNGFSRTCFVLFMNAVVCSIFREHDALFTGGIYTVHKRVDNEQGQSMTEDQVLYAVFCFCMTNNGFPLLYVVSAYANVVKWMKSIITIIHVTPSAESSNLPAMTFSRTSACKHSTTSPIAHAMLCCAKKRVFCAIDMEMISRRPMMEYTVPVRTNWGNFASSSVAPTQKLIPERDSNAATVAASLVQQV